MKNLSMRNTRVGFNPSAGFGEERQNGPTGVSWELLGCNRLSTADQISQLHE